MARNKKVEILSNDKEVLHPMTDGDCVIFEDGQTLTQKLSEDDSVKYTPEIVNSSPMFKVGEGNTVDYSDNVLDGAYERATLQGQTYVNYIQESSADEITLPTPFTEYERTQHNTLTSDEEGTLGINLVGQSYVNALQHDSEEEYVVLGESLEFQEKKVEYTNEGQIKSAMLKGQTLVNLATHKCFWNGYSTAGEFLTQSLKNNTKYMIILNSIEGIQCVSLASNSWNIMQTLMGTEDNGSYKGDLSQKLVFTFKVGENDVDVVTNIRILLSPDPTSTPDYQVMLLEYQDGMENWDIPYFEGMQSVTVSTRLENLCHKYNDGLAKNGKTFNTNSLSDRCIKLVDYKESAEATYGMKPNTKYLVQFKISNLVLDGLQGIGLQFSVGESDSTNYLFKNATKNGLITANGVYRVVLTTSDVVATSGVEIKGIGAEWENSGSSLRSLTISNIMYVEYQNGMENWDLPYFEDYQVMKPVQVESVNKNLLEVPNISITTRRGVKVETNEGIFKLTGTSNGSGGRNDLFENEQLFILNLKKGKTYTMSIIDLVENGSTIDGFFITDNKTGAALFGCNSENNFIHTYTPLIDMDVHFGMNVLVNETYNSTFKVLIEESSTATEYVPHQSKTTYSWDEVILRKIGDVEDTLDLTTGEWVQRIGEIVLADQKNIGSGSRTSDTWFEALVYLDVDDYIKVESYGSTQIINNKLPLTGNAESMTTSYIRINAGANNYIVVGLNVEDMGGLTGYDGWNYYVKNNNVVIQYVLAKPIVHKVNLSRPNLQVYDDITHIHTKCLDGTLIPNIYLPSDISYPAILEPGKKYNVCINHTEVSADNPLKVNVGGTEITMTDSRMTLTTPATLTNSNVSFTGKGNKIKESMLIKNSSLLTRDLPHFNGIGSVQLGKTIENLCSSKYIKGGSAQATRTDTLDTVKITTTTKGSYVLEFPILTPLENGKTYFVYAPVSGGWATYSFVRTYDNSKGYLQQPMGDMENPQQYIVTIDQLDNQYASLCIGCHGTISVGTTYTITRPILCEYEPGMEDWDWESIGYFTGTKNIGNEFMRVQNKNLFDVSKVVQGVTYNDGRYDSNPVTMGDIRCTLLINDAIKIKPKTTYTISVSPDLRIGYYLLNENKNITYDSGWLESTTFTTPSNSFYLIYNIRKNDNTSIKLSDITSTSIQLEESSTATTYTAHKHNGLYITKDQPIELTWEQGQVLIDTYGSTYTSTINNSLTTRVRNKGLLNLKPNTTYRVSLGDKTNFKYHIACFDNWDCSVKEITGIGSGWVSSVDTIFTTTEDMHKISINVAKVGDGTITPSEINHIRLEEVTDVVLRGIGDVHDELDITRGIYTQRIGEIVLDSSEYFDTSESYFWYINSNLSNENYTTFMLEGRDGKPSSSNFICDKLPNKPSWLTVETGVWADSAIILTLPTSIATTTLQLQEYLQINQLRIQYQLATPIVHKVHIGNKNEANTEVAKPNDVFTLPTLYTEQTHIDMTNNGIIPKVQSRDYIAYPILPMINRTYTLQHNLTGGVSNLTIDLLGRTQSVSYQNHKSLIYSPETMDAILHNELRISGKGKISRVMYIDGGYMDRDIPYIEGMKNAVNPIVKNVGKNLITNKIVASYSDVVIFEICKLKPNKQYIISSNYNFTQGLVVLQGNNKQFTIQDWAQNKNVFKAPTDVYDYNTIKFWKAGLSYDEASMYFHMQELEDGVQPILYEPYKENICYVDCGEIRLTPDMFEQGNIVYNSANAGATYDSMKEASHIRIRMKELIKIKPNTEYLLNVKGGYRVFVREFDVNKGKLNDSALSLKEFQSRGVFTTNANAQYISLLIGKLSDTSLPLSDFNEFNLLLIENDNIVVLRSLPNGVCDEIDLETGEYVQRVGEIVFNGDTKFDDWGERGENGLTFNYYDPQVKQLENEKVSVFADTLLGTNLTTTWGGTPYTVAQADNGNYLQICLNKNDLRENTRDGINDYFLQNPVTVQYELAEPIVKDIVIHNYPHSYEGGHVIIENGDPNTPIPAQLTYRAVTNRSGQIQQHTEQVEKQEREINELETLILANIHLSQTR